jgi:hypothetical protein
MISLPRTWTRCLGFLIFALVMSSADGRMAAAETPEAERAARRLFESGEAHFRSGLFAEALAEYQAGYEIHPLPGFLINIAQCQRRLGNLTVARATYRKFIMVAPDSPFVPQVKALIAELDVLTQDLATTPPPTTTKPEDAQAKEPAVSPPAPEPPAQTSPGPGVAAAGIDLTSPPAPAEQPPAQKRWWLWGLIGAAAAGAVTTIVLLSLPPGTNTLHEGSMGTLRR